MPRSEGQRRLVREVHHRVKNNLQVVASLLNIHGRSADQRRKRARLMRRSAAGSTRSPSSTATICRNGGQSRDRASPPADRACRRAPRGPAPDERADDQRRARHRPRLRRPRMSPSRSPSWSPRSSSSRCSATPEIADRDRAAANERTDRPAVASNARCSPNPIRGDKEKTQFERIVSGLARQLRSLARPRTWPPSASICRSSRPSVTATTVTALRRKFLQKLRCRNRFRSSDVMQFG